MASFRKRGSGRWQAQVRKSQVPLAIRFPLVLQSSTASHWSRKHRLTFRLWRYDRLDPCYFQQSIECRNISIRNALIICNQNVPLGA